MYNHDLRTVQRKTFLRLTLQFFIFFMITFQAFANSVFLDIEMVQVNSLLNNAADDLKSSDAVISSSDPQCPERPNPQWSLNLNPEIFDQSKEGWIVDIPIEEEMHSSRNFSNIKFSAYNSKIDEIDSARVWRSQLLDRSNDYCIGELWLWTQRDTGFGVISTERGEYYLRSVDGPKYLLKMQGSYEVSHRGSKELSGICDEYLGDPPLYGDYCKYSDGIPILRVLVVYTEDVKSYLKKCYRYAVDRILQNVVDRTNFVLDRSKAGVKLELAGHAGIEIEEDDVLNKQTRERGLVKFLREIHESQQGKVSKNVLDLRDDKGADLVFLLVRKVGGGLSWLRPAAKCAYAAVNVDGFLRYRSFAHELGHLLGAGHNKGSIQNKDWQPLFARGYIERSSSRSSRLSTIMSLKDGCSKECDDKESCSTKCDNINYWSNPDVKGCGYRPTGSEDHNNACVMRYYAKQAKLFR